MNGGALRTVCAWCDRVRGPGGEWRHPEDAEALGPATTHGICPECLERATTRATIAAAVTG
ncbi:MAG: hypothetical protein LJF30_05490 [Acidobacteria bacterium]|nr:hypothetical protein [Acidobacteriota bacterium]